MILNEALGEDTTDLVCKLGGPNKICNQCACKTSARRLTGIIGVKPLIPACSVVGKQMTIRKYNRRMEDQIGHRFPTNHSWACSQMTVLSVNQQRSESASFTDICYSLVQM